MIVTVTMNPAIDKTLELNTLQVGEVNRIQEVEYDVGGKGINVSKTIHYLGGTSVATGFIAGNNGKMIEKTLQDMGIVTDFVEVPGETRTNTKVCARQGGVTELNESGPEIGTDSLDKLIEKIEGHVKEDTLVVLAGSVPKGVDTGIYKRIINLVHEKQGKVLLDADGELFAKALEAVPDMIKPNREELQKYVEREDYPQKEEASLEQALVCQKNSSGKQSELAEEEIHAIAERLLKKGIFHIAVSMGAKGAVFYWKDTCVKCPPVDVKVCSTVGAGDAMVAAMAYAWEKKLERQEQIRYCMATSAGAVTTKGTKPPKKELVEDLMEKVVM